MIPARLLTAVALAAGLLVCADGAAQPVVQPVRQPAALPVVPTSAGAFVTLKVSALAAHPDLKPVLAQLAKQPDALAGVTEALGVSPLELDRVTLFWPRLGRDTSEPVLVLTTAEPFNEARVLKNLKARPVFDGDVPRSGGHQGAVSRPAVKQAAPDFKSAEPGGPGAGSFPPGVAPGEAPPVPKSVDPKPLAPGNVDEAVSFCSAQVGEVTDPLFYTLERRPFSVLFLVDERTLVFLPGSRDAELTALALLGATLKKGVAGPLTDALAEASKHTFAAGVYLPPLFRGLDRRVEPELVPYSALLAGRTAMLTGDLDKTAKLALTLTFDDATAAKRAAPVLEEGLAAVGGQWIDRQTGAMRDSRRPLDKAAAPILGAFAAGLKRAAVKTAGATVLASVEVDAGPATAQAVGDLLVAVQSRRKAELRTNNLKQIGLALHNYHDTTGRMPTNVYGPKGELLLSWRVLLLPYLEADSLYKQFKLDEPWDGPNNRLLIEKMPKVFQAPDREHEKGKTFYQGFAQREKPVPLKGLFGRPWLKDGENQGLSFAAFTDGLSNTLAVIEAGAGVVWSKPEDLPFGGAVPALGEKGWDRAPALRFDGSVLLFPTNMRPEEFWPHVTINGGEVTRDPNDDRPAPFGLRSRPDVKPPVVAQTKPAAKAPNSSSLLQSAGSSDPNTLAVLVALCRDEERAAAAQVEAAELVVQRLEQLAGKGAVTEVEVVRAKAVVAVASARLDETRRAVEKCEAALKAAVKVAPRK